MSNTIEIYKEKLNNNNEIRIILFYKEPTSEEKDTVIFPIYEIKDGKTLIEYINKGKEKRLTKKKVQANV